MTVAAPRAQQSTSEPAYILKTGKIHRNESRSIAFLPPSLVDAIFQSTSRGSSTFQPTKPPTYFARQTKRCPPFYGSSTFHRLDMFKQTPPLCLTVRIGTSLRNIEILLVQTPVYPAAPDNKHVKCPTLKKQLIFHPHRLPPATMNVSPIPIISSSPTPESSSNRLPASSPPAFGTSMTVISRRYHRHFAIIPVATSPDDSLS